MIIENDLHVMPYGRLGGGRALNWRGGGHGPWKGGDLGRIALPGGVSAADVGYSRIFIRFFHVDIRNSRSTI